ncbi:hypothetical protein B0T17DRAFT_516141 [Bombardia bombarda]|uniref:FAD-binding domain-containing protein n=1 Tax=Bombardia bombarda TaxID=252184 RepID=A0AA39XJY4_9PEZI|nr:hypothetical protein B0T17DRAFT_516141 [Bombardia bombarda]
MQTTSPLTLSASTSSNKESMATTEQPKDAPLHIIIIGAGLAGLATALSTALANPSHRVTILETVRELQEIGAGLQVTPNGTALLSRWGLAAELAPLAAVPSSLSVHRFDGTKLLAHEPHLQETVRARYGNPFWDLHRVDLQRAMVARCKGLGVEVRLDSRAVAVDFDEGVVTLQDGRRVEGDVVVLCDGLWSGIRSQFIGEKIEPALTGDLAYRITLRVDELSGPDRDELAAFVADPQVHFWVGPASHAVGYSVSAGKVYNLVLLCPDDLPAEVVKADGDLEELGARLERWDPLLRKFVAQVKSVLKWKLMWLDGDALPRWANEKGTFFMAGDCCHPMLPYLAQGANSSLEDGAVLGSLLGKVERTEQLVTVAEMYQRLRMERGRKIQLEGFKQRHDFHLEDGEEQERRDELMVKAMIPDGEGLKAPFPSRWTCPEIQPFLYGYDAYVEAEKAFRENPF